MHLQTRILLAALADELNDAILDELGEEALEAEELAERLDVSIATVNRRLKDLRELEFLEVQLSPPSPGEAGRRPRRFRLRDSGSTRFRNTADAFALAHFEARTKSIDDHLEASREKQVKGAPPDEEAG